MPSVITIPEELAHELDRLAEAEHKLLTAYIVDILWRDVRRNKQREALKLSAGAWNPADHRELAEGGAAHVEQIRSEPDERFEDAIRHQKRLMAIILLDTLRPYLMRFSPCIPSWCSVTLEKDIQDWHRRDAKLTKE